jgi:hypothetical protein
VGCCQPAADATCCAATPRWRCALHAVRLRVPQLHVICRAVSGPGSNPAGPLPLPAAPTLLRCSPSRATAAAAAAARSPPPPVSSPGGNSAGHAPS